MWAAENLKEIIMKRPKEILELYGECCVSESSLTTGADYSGEKGKDRQKKDNAKLENIRGQKQIIEWLFE